MKNKKQINAEINTNKKNTYKKGFCLLALLKKKFGLAYLKSCGGYEMIDPSPHPLEVLTGCPVYCHWLESMNLDEKEKLWIDLLENFKQPKEKREMLVIAGTYGMVFFTFFFIFLLLLFCVK